MELSLTFHPEDATVYDHSPELDKIAPAIAAAQAELGPIAKSATNKFDNYKYATLGDYVAALAPVLAKHGLSVLTSTGGVVAHERTTTKGNKENAVTLALTLTILHVSGQFITLEGVGEGQDRADKSSYKAVTGGRKYALASAFGLATTDDPEKDETVGTDKATKTARSRKATSESRPTTGLRTEYALPNESRTPAQWGEYVSQLSASDVLPFFTAIVEKDDVLAQEGVRHAVCNAVALKTRSVFSPDAPERAAIRQLLDVQKGRLGTNAD